MIFLTVGTHEPFDRLVIAVEKWCDATPGHPPVFGQITDRSSVEPRHFASVQSLSPEDYARRFEEARLIISHAGMGSIITAMQRSRPIVVLPRRAAFGETRNDHQYATALKLAERRGIFVAFDETEIDGAIERGLDAADRNRNLPGLPEFADEGLIRGLREFIHSPRS